MGARVTRGGSTRHSGSLRLACALVIVAASGCSSARTSSPPASMRPETTPAGSNPMPNPSRAVWEPTSSGGPPMAVEFSMVFVPEVGRSIAFGGRDQNFRPVDETWEYDQRADTWTRVDVDVQPPWRSNHALVHDPRRGTVLLFGGSDLSRDYGDLWEFDPGQRTWTELAPADPPTPRQMHGMVYDTEHDVVILFGGRSDSGTRRDDTWAYDPAANTWQLLEPTAPPPAQDHVNLVYDEAHGRSVLFRASLEPGSGSTSTWTFDYGDTEWTPIATDASPGSDHARFLFDPATERNVLVGNSSTGEGVATWTFHLGSATWTQLSSTTAPDYREHFGVALDLASGVFTLSGGFPARDQWALIITPSST